MEQVCQYIRKPHTHIVESGKKRDIERGGRGYIGSSFRIILNSPVNFH